MIRKKNKEIPSHWFILHAKSLYIKFACNFKPIIRSVCKKDLPIAHLLLILHWMQSNNARLHCTLVDLTEFQLWINTFINIFVIGKYVPKNAYFAHWLNATWQYSHGIFFFDSIFHYKEWILMNYSDNGFVSYCFSVNLL